MEGYCELSAAKLIGIFCIGKTFEKFEEVLEANVSSILLQSLSGTSILLPIPTQCFVSISSLLLNLLTSLTQELLAKNPASNLFYLGLSLSEVVCEMSIICAAPLLVSLVRLI